MNKILSKYQGEVAPITFDFTNALISGDSISSVSWHVSVVSGVDPSPNDILVGPASFTSKTAHHIVGGGVEGCVYEIECEVTTANTLVNILFGEVEIYGTSSVARQKLADYCLRALGGGMVNIEITGEQITDRIEEALQFAHEYYFDAIERDYYIHKITGTQITVADATGFQVGQAIREVNGNINTSIYAISGNVITIQHQLGYSKLSVNNQITNGSNTTTVTAITLGDVDNGYIPAGENIVGVKRLLNLTNVLGSGEYIFNVQYQIMMSEIQNLTKGTISYFYNVQQYLGHLDFIMKKEKDFRFNRRMNRLYIDVNWTTDIKVGDIIVAEIYRAIEDSEFPELLEDIWIKKYTTALLKRQWGQNLGKYKSITLPGGITYSGAELFQQASEDIEKLEIEAIATSAPLEFAVG